MLVFWVFYLCHYNMLNCLFLFSFFTSHPLLRILVATSLTAHCWLNERCSWLLHREKYLYLRNIGRNFMEISQFIHWRLVANGIAKQNKVKQLKNITLHPKCLFLITYTILWTGSFIYFHKIIFFSMGWALLLLPI